MQSKWIDSNWAYLLVGLAFLGILALAMWTDKMSPEAVRYEIEKMQEPARATTEAERIGDWELY